MFLSRSFRRKLLATTLAAVALVLLYDATVIDSRNMTRTDQADKARKVAAGARLDFVATAYCKRPDDGFRRGRAGGHRGSGRSAPAGGVRHLGLDGVPEQYRGIYTVMDTGPKVLGRHVDLYMWSCDEALDFGRRDILLTVLRLGWSPNAKTADEPSRTLIRDYRRFGIPALRLRNPRTLRAFGVLTYPSSDPRPRPSVRSSRYCS